MESQSKGVSNPGARHRRFAAVVGMLSTALSVSTPASAERAFSSKYLVVDDLRVHYLEAGSGDPVILLHGLVASADMWRGAGAELARHFRVIVPDARGRGETPEGSGSLSGGRFARDVVGLMDGLAIKRAHVVGHSQGSLTAVHLLIDYPERAATAVLVGSPMLSLRPPTPGIQTMFAEMTGLARGEPIDDPILQEFAATYRRMTPDPHRFQEFVGRLLAERSATYDASVLPLIRTPTLVFVAKRDELIPEAHFRALAAAIPGARVAEFPFGTHIVPIETPAECAEAIAAFLNDHPISPFAQHARPR